MHAKVPASRDFNLELCLAYVDPLGAEGAVLAGPTPCPQLPFVETIAWHVARLMQEPNPGA
jgi:hypothetical protein